MRLLCVQEEGAKIFPQLENLFLCVQEVRRVTAAVDLSFLKGILHRMECRGKLRPACCRIVEINHKTTFFQNALVR